MTKVWIVIITLAVVLGGLYWYFVRDNSVIDSNATNTTNTNSIAVGEPNPSAPDPLNDQPNKPTNNQQSIMNATFHTNMGDITVAFNPETPNTVANFIKLAQSGFYNGTKFHRVIKGFMNQGGDPLSKDDSMMDRWGTGGPGYQFADEITRNNKNNAGTLAMANAGPNTNGSQFFFNAANNNFLDSKHTVFAVVTAGAEVVMAINSVQTGTADRPVKPVVIESITLK
jgi:peptidylprolyl isomerase